MRKKSAENRVSKMLSFYVAIFFLAFSSPENSSALPANRVKSVLFEEKNCQEITVIQLEHRAQISWFALKNPNRIAVDIHDTYLPEVSCQKAVKGNLIKNIRVSQNTKDAVRAVLDLASTEPYKFQSEQGVQDSKPTLYLKVCFLKNKATELVERMDKAQIPPISNISNLPDTGDHLQSSPPPDSGKEGQEVAVLLDNDFSKGIFDNTDTPSPQTGLSFSGSLHAKTSLQIKEDETIENNTGFRNQILVEARYQNSIVVSGSSDYLFFGPEDKTDDHNFEITEAKWRHMSKKTEISLGKQILRWGKTDQISLIDTLNPEDLREFILPEYEDRKIPVWLADIRLFLDRFTLEGVVVPVFESSRFDYFNTDWSVFGHMKKEILDAPVPQSLKIYFRDLSVREQYPGNETEWALRLSGTIQSMDIGLTFHHTTEDFPCIANFPVKNIRFSGDLSPDTLIQTIDSAVFTDQLIEAEYRRTNIIGFSFETTLHTFGLRGEAAWQENESFLTSSLNSVRSPTLTWILGGDYTMENNTYLNLQLAHRHISQYDPAILYFDRDTLSILGEIRMDIVSDWLKACVKLTQNLTDNSLYLNPYIQYTYITNLDCRAGASLFSGDRDTWFGRYRDHDIIYVDIAYRF